MSDDSKVPLPTRQQVLEFIKDSPDHVGKREIARAFQLKGAAKIHLKKILKELEGEGLIDRGRNRRFARPGSLPDVTVVQMAGIDTDGEIYAKPLSWHDETDPPRIYMAPERKGTPALKVGDRVLAKLRRINDHTYEGRTIRHIASAPQKLLGIFEMKGTQASMRPTDRRAKNDYLISKGDTLEAKPGDLVLCEPMGGRKYGLRSAKVVEVLGDMEAPKAVSLISIHANGIPTDFKAETLKLAEKAGPVELGDRRDLRDTPLVTIDGEDARDFDDAVYAQPDDDENNKGGWIIFVAIADVAHYVRPGDALDKEAYKRGNSCYFPDRVVPMLPEALSNGWCSLVPHEERGCLAVRMRIDQGGELLSFKFMRGLMRSHARLTYTQVQAALDGNPDDTTGPLMDSVIKPLFGAYQSLLKNRESRGVLELDIPERKVIFAEDGTIAAISQRERFDSHKLIEEMMILANVAAAKALQKRGQPCMYRVHPEPSMEKIESLSEFLRSLDIKLAKGNALRPATFNGILQQVKDTDHSHMVSTVVLRSQAQASYSPDNLGHFGLALRNYAHFTSPIRRYSDVLVHRALIRGYALGEGKLETDHADFEEMGEHISGTERRAATAERDAMDRYTAAFMSSSVGANFAGRINGVTRFGLFVTLDETGADGLIPISTLPEDYYIHEEELHQLVGRRSGLTFRLGQRIDIKLVEADKVTGGLMFELLVDSSSIYKGTGAPRKGRWPKPRPMKMKGRKPRRR